MSAKNIVLLEQFGMLHDPRSGNAVRHNFFDILVITLCAAICGADAWTDGETFGHAKIDWLRRFLALPYSIPSHDTFRRVFAVLKPDTRAACFAAWTEAVVTKTHGEIVAVDGKTMRRSFDRQSDKAALQMSVRGPVTIASSLARSPSRPPPMKSRPSPSC